MTRSQFDKDKALEAIIYIAHNLPQNPGFFQISKMLYLADKLHLQQYGRFICEDDYYAMDHGPVPSHTYNLMKSDFPPENSFYTSAYNIIPEREADLDEFSDSDLECLDEIIEAYGAMSFRDLREICHDEAWHKAWDTRGDYNSNRIPIENIVAMFENHDDLLAYLGDPNP